MQHRLADHADQDIRVSRLRNELFSAGHDVGRWHGEAGRLEEYPKLSAKRLFDEIRAAGYPGGYSRVRDYVRGVRPREGGGGGGAFRDAGGTPRPSGLRDLHATVETALRAGGGAEPLPAAVAVFLPSADHGSADGRTGRAFARFGGVPAELLFDQMRAVVLSDDRRGGGELVLNAEFLRFAAPRRHHPSARLSRVLWQPCQPSPHPRAHESSDCRVLSGSARLVGSHPNPQRVHSKPRYGSC